MPGCAGPGPFASATQPSDGRATPGLAISRSRELVTPMSTEREKLVRDINGLKESVRLGWLETAAKPMTPAERLELRKSIDSLVTELNTLRIKLDRPPKVEA